MQVVLNSWIWEAVGGPLVVGTLDPIRIPVVPHKAVAEVSKIGNL